MKKNKYLLLILVFVSCLALAACTSEINDPVQIIKDSYGNQEYSISFDTQGADTVLSDLSYTASNIPELPTPIKVGYVFEGWYLDSGYTVPYTDGILYLYMSDVTLHAKWNKEEFSQNGTYDIEFEAHIMEDTVSFLNGEAENYKNFTKDIITDETYIEKSDGKLQLKIQYDCGAIVPFASEDIYTVSVASALTGNTSIRISDRIASDAETVKTIFVNINNFDLGSPIYFNITVTDKDYSVKYSVEFNVTRFIGFSKTYVNPDTILEDGYYLAKTYYYSDDGDETMVQSYNPVYSYIIAKDGNYSLVKPYMPYPGLVNFVYSDNAVTNMEDYYNRAMTFSSMLSYYEIEFSGQKSVIGEEVFLPQYYNGKYYGTLTTEFHADTGRYYNIYDLGGDIKKEFMITGAVTGFMETLGMGAVNLIMTVDYEHIIKLTDIDYSPLSGDYYQYEKDMQLYSGRMSDISPDAGLYELTEEYGIDTEIINFFYSKPYGSVSDGDKRIHSSRITVAPTAYTASSLVKESRNNIAYFKVQSQVYDYDSTNGKLYADMMSVGKFGGNGLRETTPIKLGKTCENGEEIRLAQLYAEKVDSSADFATVTADAYGIKNGVVDYSDKINITNGKIEWNENFSFKYQEGVAIVFNTANQYGNQSEVVELAKKEEPQIDISNYDTSALYEIGEEVKIPSVSYTWQGNGDDFMGNFYEEDVDYLYINSVKAVLVNADNNNEISYFATVASKFQMKSENMFIAYELNNKYGELKMFCLPFNAEKGTEYTIKDGNNVVYTGAIKSENGQRSATTSDYDYSDFISENSLQEMTNKVYQFETGGINLSMLFYYAEIVTDAKSYGLNDIAMISDAVKSAEYAYINFWYRSDYGDIFKRSYLYHMTLNGLDEPKVFSDEKYFTDYTYTISPPLLTGGEKTLSKPGISILKFESGEYKYTSGAASYSSGKLIFTKTGQYRILFNYSLRYDMNGNRVFKEEKESKNARFYEDIVVVSGTGSVTIAYLTDETHKYKDSIAYKEITLHGVKYYSYEIVYSLKDNIVPISAAKYFDSEERLFAWVQNPDYDFTDITKTYISGIFFNDYIGSFGTDYLYLYPIWDKGIKVVFTADTDDGTEIIEEKAYYLETMGGNLSMGYYKVDLNEITLDDSMLSDYGFVGWDSELFGGTIILKKDKYENIIRVMEAGEYTVHAVLKKRYTVEYQIEPEYSNAFFGYEKVLDGEKVVDDIDKKMSLVCLKDGYTFAGWYVKGDEAKTIINLTDFPISKDITFVAEFVPTGE